MTQTHLQGFYGQPWAVLEPYLFEMEAALQRGAPMAAESTRSGPRKGSGLIAVLPLSGPIFHKENWFTRFFGGTGLDNFARIFRTLVDSAEVKTIVLDVDSPGGEVSGTPEMAAEIFAARQKKQVVAVIDALGASGAYWLASAAGTVVMTPSGLAGSIGVYALHLDFSKQMEMAGVKPTFISAGKYKTEGNELEPLGDEAAAAIQRQVNNFYGAFVRDVARHRGVSVERVRNGFGQGRVVSAQEALREGMVDGIGTLDETLAGLQAGRGPRTAAQAGVAWSHAEQRVLLDCRDNAEIVAAFRKLRAACESSETWRSENAYLRFELAMESAGKRRDSFAWLAVDVAVGKRPPGALGQAHRKHTENRRWLERQRRREQYVTL